MRGLGLCGSGLAVYTGSRPVDAPWLMGHEGVVPGGTALIYDHPADFDDTVAVLDRGAITPGKVLQARFDLTDAAEAFASVRSVAGKPWISFS